MKKSNVATTPHQPITSSFEQELIALLFTAVKRIESKGYSTQEIETMIDEAMNQMLPCHSRLATK